MYNVYVLQSISRNYLYVGITDNLERRVAQHQNGKERTTSPYKPFLLILHEEHSTRIAARQREKYLKSGSGKEWIKRKILGTMK